MEKVVCLVSGGIDSPVAGYLMKKKGFEVVFLYCENQPKTDGATLDKIKRLVKKVKGRELYVASHGGAMAKIVDRCESQLRCVLCKRMMYRSAEKLAKQVKAKAIVTGENLGQVASQTLANMAALDSATKLPVLRPLLTMEKNETIATARRIGTYDISIEKSPSCPFVPKHPETQADLAEVESEELFLDLDKLVKRVELERIV
jgi:thiamine biosynthesis protein ThiI